MRYVPIIRSINFYPAKPVNILTRKATKRQPSKNINIENMNQPKATLLKELTFNPLSTFLR